MNTISGFISTIANTFKTATGTGLDTITAAPIAAQVAEDLLKHDLIPANHTDIEESFAALTGDFPREGDLAEVELFLDSFGWLA